MARSRLELLAGHAAVLLVQDCLNSRVCFLSSLHLSFRAEFRGAKRTRGISNCLVRAMARDYDFCIYIVTNRNHSVLYIGVTNSFTRRKCNHREDIGSNFPARYQCKTHQTDESKMD